MAQLMQPEEPAAGAVGAQATVIAFLPEASQTKDQTVPSLGSWGGFMREEAQVTLREFGMIAVRP